MDHSTTSSYPAFFSWLRHRRRRVVGMLILLLLAGMVCYFFVDQPVARWANTFEPTPHTFWEIITRLGLSQGYLVPAGILLICYKLITKSPLLAWRSALVFCGVGGTGLLVNLLKWIFGRYRPSMLLHENLFGFSFFKAGYAVNSFPSGHSATAGALAVIGCILMPKFSWLWIALGLLIGVSRVFVCAHYPSDVIAGLSVGVVFTLWVHQTLVKPSEMIPAQSV